MRRRKRRRIHHKFTMDKKGYVKNKVKGHTRWFIFGNPRYPSNYYDFM